MQAPLISILIPFKNTAEYLPECLDSILAQSYSHWELVIVDDHSTDISCSIVADYAKKDARITLYKNEGSGIIEALRMAFSNSTGAFITRMDSDDIMSLNKLEVLSKSLKAHGRQHIALGLVKYFSEYGLGEGYSNYEKWLNALTKSGQNYSEIFKECVIPSPCWMIHREDLIACNAFDEDRYPEDYDLTFRFYESGYKCIPCDELLHYWRDYATRTSRIDPHYEQNYFLDLKLFYFLKLNYDKARPLVIWGAGSKGKNIARLLVENGTPFHWICDNPNKIGRHIYDQELKAFNFLESLSEPQSIITVANSTAQLEIRAYLNDHSMKSMIDFFFFC